MLAFRLETLEEAKVILTFHVVGTVMELFKTYAGSWVYPEPALLRVGSRSSRELASVSRPNAVGPAR